VQVISSGQTFFSKKILPILWFGMLVLFFMINGMAALKDRAADAVAFLVMPVAMLLFGFFLFRKLLWNLADEVQDGGSYLLVRKGSIEQRVPLANIMNVSVSQFTNPKRVTLRLRAPCELGDEIAFIPKLPMLQWNPFARNVIAEDLIRRVDQARMEARA